MNSDAKILSEDDLSFWNDRDLKFRVLILGRANAGKTTILERLTGASTDEAEVWRDGEILPDQLIQTVKGQIDRGLRDINDEIRFRSKPGFVFHDSRGIEAGSATELSTVQRFFRMCLPLDECRELFESEREIFRLLVGTAKVPLVVIFTKRDGAVSKETSQILMNFPESTRIRSIRKEARKKAELKVINCVKELGGELRGLGLVDNTTVFLTTSGIIITIVVDSWMEMPTVDAARSCEQLINLTEECLTGPRIKTLLSVVWGHNLLKRGFWCLYWALRYNTSNGGAKLGSGAPSMWNLIQRICSNMSFHDSDDWDGWVLLLRLGSVVQVCPFARRGWDYFWHDDHHDYWDDHDYDDDFDKPTDVPVLAVAVFQPGVLTLASSTAKDWILTVASFLEDNKVLLHEKANTITAQVAAIVGKMKHRNIIPRLNLRHLPWKFSDREATILATELSQSIVANLM
ncbi:hypothetical protein B0H14DRAFT_2646621 [Mycena olivaceomarginata]|nr:hypothetical protein B0H14DRAFT_2646621 [Mycena olivaceomarginata]